MSLAESEALLRGHAESEATKDSWRSFGSIVLFVLAIAGAIAVAFLSVSFTAVAWIVGIAGVLYALGAIASADRK